LADIPANLLLRPGQSLVYQVQRTSLAKLHWLLTDDYMESKSAENCAVNKELAAVLEMLVIFSGLVIIGGDFNISSRNSDDPDTGRLSNHSLVVCHLPVVVDESSIAERVVRRWPSVDRDL
jgi:hypothetical protein